MAAYVLRGHAKHLVLSRLSLAPQSPEGLLPGIHARQTGRAPMSRMTLLRHLNELETLEFAAHRAGRWQLTELGELTLGGLGPWTGDTRRPPKRPRPGLNPTRPFSTF